MKPNPESARADKAGEITATDKDTLTAEGISSLLKSEFAKDAAAEPEPPEKEKPEGEPEGGEVQGAAEGEQNQPGEGQEAQPGEGEQEQEQPKGEEGTEEGAEEQGQEQGQVELPAALQAVIEEWDGRTELTPELEAVVQRRTEKRIGKVIGQREQERTARQTAEAKVSELEAKLEQAGQANVPVLMRPVEDEKALNEMEGAAKDMLADAENYLDGTADAKETERVEAYMQSERLDQPGLKRRVREMARWVTADLPKVRKNLETFIAEETRLDAEAREEFPWLTDKTSKEYGLAQEILRVFPDLPRRTPGHKMAVGVHVLGLLELEKRRKARNGGKAGATQTRTGATAKAPPKTPTAGSAAPRVAATNGKTRAEEAARQRLKEKPNSKNAAELLKVELAL